MPTIQKAKIAGLIHVAILESLGYAQGKVITREIIMLTDFVANVVKFGRIRGDRPSSASFLSPQSARPMFKVLSRAALKGSRWGWPAK